MARGRGEIRLRQCEDCRGWAEGLALIVIDPNPSTYRTGMACKACKAVAQARMNVFLKPTPATPAFHPAKAKKPATPRTPGTLGPPRPMRVNIWTRDKERCRYCGMKLTVQEATLDHVIPKAQQGQSRPENLVTACRDCNSEKGGRRPEEAGMPIIPLELMEA